MSYKFQNLTTSDYTKLFSAFRASPSQLQQEVFVLLWTGFSPNGFFVEFGATDGKTLSNTSILETLGWNGILVEPSKGNHKALKQNRKCIIDTRCVYSISNKKIEFSENLEEGELSAIKEYLPVVKKGAINDKIVNERAKTLANTKTKTYKVKTVSLLDLLDEHNAPKFIDYISIDTEGSEFDILNAFDFDKYRFKVLTVEHNYGAQRDDIKNLLEKNGYKRVLEKISKYDDWYINTKLD